MSERANEAPQRGAWPIVWPSAESRRRGQAVEPILYRDDEMVASVEPRRPGLDGLGPPLAPSPTMPRRRTLALAQGLFLLSFGAWPVVHMPSFVAVTGPKRDLWLVRTVGSLLAVVGISLLDAARTDTVNRPIMLLASGTATALAAIDVAYGVPGVIPRRYLGDAGMQLGWAASWAFSRA